MIIKTILAIACASALNLAYAEAMPNNGFSGTGDKSFIGNGEDAVINTVSANPNTDKNYEDGSTIYHAFNTINHIEISGYNDFIINNSETTDKTWAYALYSPYSGNASTDTKPNISVNVKNDVLISDCDIAVHTMTGSTISINAGHNFEVNSDGNGVFAQNTSNISVIAGNNINISGYTNVVGIMNSSTQDSASISLISGKKISITATKSNGNAIRTQNNGGSLTFIAPEGLDVTGNINASTGTVAFSNQSSSTTTVNIHGQSSAAFGTLKGTDITFNFDRLAPTGKTLSILEDQTSGAITANIGYTDLDNLSVDEASRILATGFDADSIHGYASTYLLEVDENGQITVEGSDITKSTNDLAALNLVSWRNETTNINDRMSTLRSNPSMIGAWARYNGGEYQYDARSIKNQFNTVEVGVDAQVDPQWVVGASFSYTSGNGDMDFGQADTDTYAGALYALWTHEKGSFIDFVMKAGRMSSDFEFRNRLGGGFDNGTLDQTGFIVGVETGHRFALPMNAFVEPQVQLTYSRLSCVSETTAQRQVNLEASDSLLGRVGFMAGIICPNDRGAAYVKASFVRDFRGDIDGTYSARSGQAVYSLSQDLDDNWFEYAVGANFKVTDNFITFVDVSKTAGADIDLNWRANIGAKIFF